MSTRRTYFGRTFALGSVPSSERNNMLGSVELLYQRLDRLTAQINVAASTGTTSQPIIDRWLDARDALRARLDDLSARVDVVDTAAEVEAWRASLAEAQAAVDDYMRRTQSAIEGATTETRAFQGLWAVGLAGAAIGTVLLVRRYGRRRGR